MKALIENIKITSRVRKELTKIDELAGDIEAQGLINPVTVMSLDGGEFRLLAGLRRLRAFEMLGRGEIDIHVVAPADAEAELRIEISENEQREAFTFSETVDYGRLLEEIVKEKSKKRQLEGASAGGKIAGNGRSKDNSLTPQGAEGNQKVREKETREIVAEKLGMGKTTYDRAKYIADNAPDEVIEELDNGKRSIRGVYDELKAKEKTGESAEDAVIENTAVDTDSEDVSHDADTDGVPGEAGSWDAESEQGSQPEPPKASDKKKHSDNAAAPAYPAGMLSKSDEEAIERNRVFNAMSPDEKVVELKRQLKYERVRANTAESELARLKELRHNDNYHKDGIIQNLESRLERAEARVRELEASLDNN